jgi:hypothetical protein
MIRQLSNIVIKSAALAALAVFPIGSLLGQSNKETFVPDRHSQAITLASGSQSEVREPFVFVARSGEALDKLSELVRLPDIAFGTDFTKAAVVAAFAGEKPTGGFSVEISAKDGNAAVSEKAPPADAMVTEVITTPFAVAVVPVEEEESLKVDVPGLWKESAETYTIMSGFFSVSGGFAPSDRTIVVAGVIDVMRHGDLVTFLLIDATSADMRRELLETVSAAYSGSVWIADRMEAGSFLERPHPPLRIKATFEGNWLKMTFEPGKRAYVVNDGYIAKGEIAAKRNPPELDAPLLEQPPAPEEKPLPPPPPPAHPPA